MQISAEREVGFDAADVVASLYRALLNREPDAAGLEGHVKAVHERGLQAVIQTFPASVEYQRIARPGPFWNYTATFDPVATIRAHENRERKAVPNHRVNFFGVAVNVGRFAPQLELDNIVEPPPIPANWHGDITEFGSAIRAVERAGDTFTMAELGCGWGCWMNITAAVARLAGRKPFVIGVEGDEGHLEFSRESLATNGISTTQYKLIRGIAAAKAGTAFFPKQERAGSKWGLAPVFAASPAQVKTLRKDENYVELKMIPLSEVIGDLARLDLLHIDIQGGETDLIRDSMDILNRRVAYIVVGTHSRVIDGQIIDILGRDGGWKLEIERPCFFTIQDGRPQTLMDGVQGWYNTRF